MEGKPLAPICFDKSLITQVDRLAGGTEPQKKGRSACSRCFPNLCGRPRARSNKSGQICTILWKRCFILMSQNDFDPGFGAQSFPPQIPQAMWLTTCA
jgi:hypothetical protein